MEQEAPLHHFSHAHPLHLLNIEPKDGAACNCNACELPCTGPALSCSPCGYILHKSCAQAAHTICHPAHPTHPLTLLLAPPYPNGSFRCDACGRDGSAFAYHCDRCQFDLHVPCAFLPTMLTHPSHHQHPMVLTTSIAFNCDLCGGSGEAHHWLYLCTPCDYGGHVDCFTSGARAPPHQEQLQEENEEANTPEQQLFLAQLRLQHAKMMADAMASSMNAIKNLIG